MPHHPRLPLLPAVPSLVNGVRLPADYRGPAHVGGRPVWWTGRVAIGLRHQPPPQPLSDSHLLLQRALLLRQPATA